LHGWRSPRVARCSRPSACRGAYPPPELRRPDPVGAAAERGGARGRPSVAMQGLVRRPGHRSLRITTQLAGILDDDQSAGSKTAIRPAGRIGERGLGPEPVPAGDPGYCGPSASSGQYLCQPWRRLSWAPDLIGQANVGCCGSAKKKNWQNNGGQRHRPGNSPQKRSGPVSGNSAEDDRRRIRQALARNVTGETGG